MKIDTHQHYWHYHPPAFPWISEDMPALRQDRMPSDCLPAMQACGVDAVMAVQARGEQAETDFLLGLAAQDPRIVGVVGWADLAAPALEAQLDQWAGQTALRGLRHILQDEPDITTL
ncbi:MAG: amidohydrolase family protein, partial [Rhodoferax sp.]